MFRLKINVFVTSNHLLTSSSLFQSVQQRLRLEPPEIQKQIKPGEFVIWFDLNSTSTLVFIYSVFFGFILSEAVSIGLVWFVLTLLKKNSGSFSKNTYRLHRQFTLLLAVQVGFFGELGETLEDFDVFHIFSDFLAYSPRPAHYISSCFNPSTRLGRLLFWSIWHSNRLHYVFVVCILK